MGWNGEFTATVSNIYKFSHLQILLNVPANVSFRLAIVEWLSTNSFGLSEMQHNMLGISNIVIPQMKLMSPG